MLFTIKLYLHLNGVLVLNWIVWNRTIFIKMDLALNNLQRLICHKTQTANQPTIYLEINLPPIIWTETNSYHPVYKTAQSKKNLQHLEQACTTFSRRDTHPAGNMTYCCIPIIIHNLWTSMNERTHLFIKIYVYISHTLFSKGLMFLLCVWEMFGDRDRLLYWPNFFSWP